MQLKIALIQMNSGNDMAANIETFRQYVSEAATRGAALVATPENTFMMDSWRVDDMEKPVVCYTQDKHPGIQAASEAAKKNNVWLLVGGVAVLPDRHSGESRNPEQPLKLDTGVRRYDENKTYNRSILFNPLGEVTATYDKLHLFDVNVGDGQSYVESARYLAGEKPVVAAVDGKWLMVDGKQEKNPSTINHQLSTKLGLSICYDVRFPYLYRKLAMEGAEILTVPAAFVQLTGEAHWHILLRARAIENGCFVIAPAQCGTHPGGRKTFGHSLIIDPWGRVLADGGTKEGVVMADIDLSEVQKTRAKIPSLAHCRSAVIGDYSI